MKLRFLVTGLLLLTYAASALAANFSIIPIPSDYIAFDGSPMYMRYKFRIENDAPFPLYLHDFHTSGDFMGSIRFNKSKSTCTFYARQIPKPISPKSSCLLVFDYSGIAPHLLPDTAEKILKNSLVVTDQLGMTINYVGNEFKVRVMKKTGKLASLPIKWTQSYRGISNFSFPFLKNINGILFAEPLNDSASIYRGLYRSTDKGKTWTPVTGFLDNTSVLSMENINDHIFFAGTNQHGVYKSTDKGKSWKRVFKSDTGVLSMLHVNDTLFAGFADNGLLKSHNEGNTWEMASGGIPKKSTVYSLINADGTLFAGMSKTIANKSVIFRSKDLGKKWEPLTNFTSSNPVKTLLYANKVLLANTYLEGVWYSTDKGDNWKRGSKKGGVPGLFPAGKQITSFSNANDTFFMGVAKDVLYKSENKGVSWEEVKGGGYPSGIDTLSLAKARKDNSNLDSIFAGTRNRGVYESTDKGTNWTQLQITNSSTALVTKLIKYHNQKDNKDILFAGLAGNGLYKSENEGTSWKKVADTFPANASVTSLLDANGTLYVGGVKGEKKEGIGLYISKDNGGSWSNLRYLHSVKATSLLYVKDKANAKDKDKDKDKGFILVGTADGLHSSNETQDSWNIVFDVFGRSVLSMVNVNGTVFVSTENLKFPNDNRFQRGKIKVKGKGKDQTKEWKWDDVKGGGYPTNAKVTSLLYTHGIIFVGTAEKGLYRSTDKGKTWAPVSGFSGKKVESLVDAGGGLMFAGGSDEGLYFSMDQGNNWEEFSILSAFNTGITCLTTINGWILAGTYSGLFKEKSK